MNEARRQLDQARGLAERLAASTPNDLAVAECLRDAMAGLARCATTTASTRRPGSCSTAS